MQRFFRFLILIIIATLLLTSCSPARLNPRYKQLFRAEGEILSLQTNGAVERQPLANGFRQLILRLPVSDDGNGIILNDIYYYVKGKKLVIFPLHNRDRQDMYTAEDGEILRLHLVSEKHIILSKAFKPRGQSQPIGEYEFYELEVATGEVTALSQEATAPELSPNFLAIVQDRLFFTNDKVKLGEINLTNGQVTDMSAQVEHKPTHAAISGDTLFLSAWHQALYTLSLSPATSPANINKIDFGKIAGLPGAIAADDNGVLLSLEGSDVNSAIYRLEMPGLEPVLLSDLQGTGISNLSHLLRDQNQIYCLANEGKKFTALPVSGS
ncbi:MAG: hypothetical protein GX749_03715 [Ruminococcaceae bacterium]|nr:hypothetical protein [Oscillospiraceae bacterium]